MRTKKEIEKEIRDWNNKSSYSIFDLILYGMVARTLKWVLGKKKLNFNLKID